MRIRAASECFEGSTRLICAYAGQCIGAFALKLMKVAPLDKMIKRDVDGLLNDLDSAWISRETEFKHDVLVQVMPVFEEEPHQDGRRHLYFRQRLAQCLAILGALRSKNFVEAGHEA